MEGREVRCEQRKGKTLGVVLLMCALIGGGAVVYYQMVWQLGPGEVLTLKGQLIKYVLPVAGLFALLLTVVAALSLAQPNPVLIVRDSGVWFRDYGGFVPWSEFTSIDMELTESWGSFLVFRMRRQDQQLARASGFGRLNAWTHELLKIPPLAIGRGTTTPDIDRLYQLIEERLADVPDTPTRGSGRQIRPGGVA